MKTKIFFVAILIIMIASCKSSTMTVNQVNLSNMSFTPNSLTVPVGTSVTWTNKDAVTHTVTSDTGLFDSGNLTSGSKYTYTFPTAGTYAYHCKIHAGMTGTIVVTAATTTTTGTGYGY